MSTETTAAWLPEPGDVITFPGAYMEFNRTLRYTVTGVAGDQVSFVHDDRSHVYTYPAAELQAIGMTRSHLWACGCLVNDAGAHRVGCPDHPEGVRMSGDCRDMHGDDRTRIPHHHVEPSAPRGLAGSAANWLDSQPEPMVRIARDIIARRAAYKLERNETAQWFDSGVLDGMRRALAMCSDRPGDISMTGAEGFISDVESSDQMVAAAAAKEQPS